MSDPRTGQVVTLQLRAKASGGSIFGKDEVREHAQVHPVPRGNLVTCAGRGFTFHVHRLSSL